MTTTINNDLRVYQVINGSNQFFCNIDQLNYVIGSECQEGNFKIYHFWNFKPQKLNRMTLDLMFEGSQLKREFNY
jgi:hypothetical protein